MLQSPAKLLSEREYQEQLEIYKAQRLKKITRQLSSSGLRFDVLLSVTEIKKIINDEAGGSYDSGIFASIILNCQDELKKNKNKITLYHFFEKFTELEFKLIHEREYQTTRLTENSLKYNHLVSLMGDPNQQQKNTPSSNLLTIEVLDFAYGPNILTDLDEDRFELFISTRRTKASMMIRHSYLKFLIQQQQHPVFKLYTTTNAIENIANFRILLVKSKTLQSLWVSESATYMRNASISTMSPLSSSSKCKILQMRDFITLL